MIKMNKLLDKNGYIFKIKTFIINLKKDIKIKIIFQKYSNC